MSTASRNNWLSTVLLCCIVLSMSLVSVSGVSANVRVPSGDLPFYAAPFSPVPPLHNDEWAVISFYRPPSCIPPNFNLLVLFDPQAFACTPHTTEGFEIWQEPGVDAVPLVWQLHGLGAVPMYFVRWPELQLAMADNVLTIVELESLTSLLRGTADFYKQTVRNETSGAVIVVQISAGGKLEDGRAFQVEAVVSGPDLRQNTRIVFR